MCGRNGEDGKENWIKERIMFSPILVTKAVFSTLYFFRPRSLVDLSSLITDPAGTPYRESMES